MVVVGLISAVAGAETFTALTTVRPIWPSRPVRSKSQGPAVSSSRRVLERRAWVLRDGVAQPPVHAPGKIALGADLAQLQALRRGQGSAESHPLAQKALGDGAAQGDGAVELVLIHAPLPLLAAQVGQQRHVIGKGLAGLADDELLGLAGELPVDGANVVAGDVLPDVEKLAGVVALAVLHHAVRPG